MTAKELIHKITSVPSKLLKDVSVHDIYESETIGVENKNVTLRMLYQSDAKTLKQEAVDKEHSRVTASMQDFG